MTAFSPIERPVTLRDAVRKHGVVCCAGARQGGEISTGLRRAAASAAARLVSLIPRRVLRSGVHYHRVAPFRPRVAIPEGRRGFVSAVINYTTTTRRCSVVGRYGD